VTRGARSALVGLGVYGLTMALAGAGLAAAPRNDATAASQASRPVAATPSAPAPSASGPVGAPETVAGATPRTSERGGAGTTLGVPKARVATPAPGQRVAFVPTTLVLPNGSQAPIRAVGVAGDGSMIIPENPREVGYWTGGAKAGDLLGSMVIAGHVDSRRYGLGVLAELKGVARGAVIELRSGGQRQRYAITATRQVSQQSLATDDQYFRQDTPSRLVVITCGGPFDTRTRRYLENYIVTASPL
jgi:hypothetical protein